MENTLKITVLCIITLIVSLVVPTISNAAGDDDYSINLNYPLKSVLINTEQKISARLTSTADATGLTNARIKVEVSGPATPKVMAKDTLGNDIDVVKEGYWGPNAGFPVGANYNVTTEFTATFPVAGTYTATISLVDIRGGTERTVTSEKMSMTVGTQIKIIMSGVELNTYSTVGAQSLADLGLANGPTNIEKGYKFAGWFTDEAFTKPIDANTPITEAITVYAKVVPETVSEEETTDTDEEAIENVDEATSEEEKDETPKTGVANYVGIAVLVIAISAATLFIIRKNRI